MKILITGATGFIGKHFIQGSKKRAWTLYALVRPSTNVDFLKKEKIKYYVFDDDVERFILFMKKEKFDGVIHLASLFLLQHETKNIKSLIDSNIYLGTMLAEACAKTDVKWFINIGTFSQHYKNRYYSPLNLYSATKKSFEDMLKYYIETSKTNFVTIKLNDTFGPNDARIKLLNIWNKISRSGEVFDMSPGKQIVNINYIGNVIDGLHHMINLLNKDKKRNFNGKSFVLKAKEETTIRNLALLFEKITGRKLNIRWGKKGYRDRENMKPWNKGKLVPGWVPKVSLAEGIRKSYK